MSQNLHTKFIIKRNVHNAYAKVCVAIIGIVSFILQENIYVYGYTIESKESSNDYKTNFIKSNTNQNENSNNLKHKKKKIEYDDSYRYVDDGYFAPWKHDHFLNRPGFDSLDEYYQYRLNISNGNFPQDDPRYDIWRERRRLYLSSTRRLNHDDHDDDDDPWPWDEGEIDSPNCGIEKEKAPCCVRCDKNSDPGLEKCVVLDRKVLEDKYYPDYTDVAGSCLSIENQVGRLDIFGDDKTYRDTTQCKAMVYEYICRFWGSENPQYDNRCSFSTEEDVDPSKDFLVPPCRSFCIQLATVCANNPDYVEICENIECNSLDDIGIDETCQKGQGQMPPGEECIIPRYATFYSGVDHVTNIDILTIITIVLINLFLF